jgi:hypothetical protein
VISSQGLLSWQSMKGLVSYSSESVFRSGA